MHHGSAAPRCNAGVTHHWGLSGLSIKRCAHLQGPILTARNATAQLPTSVQTPSTPAGRPQTDNLCASAGRIPAGLNGCVGIKPSVGRLSNQGLVPAAASLDCITCFARSVRDAATVVRIMQVSHAWGQRAVLPSEHTWLHFADAVSVANLMAMLPECQALSRAASDTAQLQFLESA